MKRLMFLTMLVGALGCGSSNSSSGACSDVQVQMLSNGPCLISEVCNNQGYYARCTGAECFCYLEGHQLGAFSVPNPGAACQEPSQAFQACGFPQ